MATSKRDTRGIPLEIRTSISDRPEELTSVVAYAFSQGGALRDMQPRDKGGTTRLTLPVGKEAQAVRVVLGPQAQLFGLLQGRGRCLHRIAPRSQRGFARGA